MTLSYTYGIHQEIFWVSGNSRTYFGQLASGGSGDLFSLGNDEQLVVLIYQ